MSDEKVIKAMVALILFGIAVLVYVAINSEGSKCVDGVLYSEYRTFWLTHGERCIPK